MKKLHLVERKPAAPAVAITRREDRDPDSKKPLRPDHSVKPSRDQPPARAHTELPRASTIPPYPKERIDD